MNHEGKDTPAIRQAFLILLITFSINVVFEMLWDTNDPLTSKIKLILLETLIIIPALILVHLKNFNLSETFQWFRVKPRLLGISVLIGIGISIITEAINRVLYQFFPMPREIAEAIETLLSFKSTEDFIFICIGAVFIAALAEEMLFRGLIQRVLETTVDTTKAVLVTAFIFTSLHFNPWHAITIMILGVLLGVLTWRCKSIFPGVVVHVVLNFISILSVNTPEAHMGWYLFHDQVSPIWICIGLVLVISGFRLFYRWTEAF